MTVTEPEVAPNKRNDLPRDTLPWTPNPPDTVTDPPVVESESVVTEPSSTVPSISSNNWLLLLPD